MTMWMWVTIFAAAGLTLLVWWVVRDSRRVVYPNWREGEWEHFIVEIGGKQYRCVGNDKNSLLCAELEEDEDRGS